MGFNSGFKGLISRHTTDVAVNIHH